MKNLNKEVNKIASGYEVLVEKDMGSIISPAHMHWDETTLHLHVS